MRREHCGDCHQTFNSQYAGDKHRMGDWSDKNPRRCLDEAEMAALGMFERDSIWYGTSSDVDWAAQKAEQA